MHFLIYEGDLEMKKTLLTTVFALAISIFLMITVSAEDNNFYKNGSDFVEIKEGEFYSNIDDQDKLYYFDKTTQSHTKILDEHIITMVDVENTIYLISYTDGESKLLSFSTADNSVKEIALLNGVVNNVCVRDSILYYILEGNIYEYNLLNNDTNILVEDGNIDLCYFKEYNSLTYFSKNSNNNYDKKYYDFSEEATQTELNEEISLFSAQSSDGISLMSANSYTPRLTAPSTTDPYYTSLNVFHTSGYGMVGNNGNCTCYAYGRSYENLGYKPSLSTANAENWYNYNKNNGYYSYGKTPYLGAVAVWSKGVIGNNSDGAGHVAIVEVIDGDTVTTSESGYNSFYFKTYTRSASHSNFSYSSSYSFQGFIYVMGKLSPIFYLSTPTITSSTVNSTSSITIKWGSISNAASYDIYRRKSGESWSGLSPITNTSSTSYKDSGLEAGTKYYYRVVAVNGSVESDESESYGVYTKPNVITSAKFSNITSSSLTISWDGVKGADYYEIYKRKPGESWSGLKPFATVSGTSYNDSGLSAGSKYYYRIYAVNESATSDDSESFDVYTKLVTPTLHSFSSITTSSLKITWNKVSGATSYDVYRRKSGESWSGLAPIKNVTTNYLIDSGLSAGTKYYYRVVAINDSTESAESESFGVYTGYNVSYNANGGSGAPSSHVKLQDTNLTLSSTKPTRTGYSFVNWNTKADGSGTTYSSGGAYSSNSGATLYAQWKPNAYTLTFDANGGTVEQINKNITYDSTYGTLPTPIRNNYQFKGWYTAKEDGVLITDTTKVSTTTAQTLYAQWEKLTPYTQIKKFGNSNYSVELFNLDSGCTVIFATYQNNRLVELYPATYDGNKIPFATTKQFDTIKVMAWSNFTTLKPLCEVNSTVIE